MFTAISTYFILLDIHFLKTFKYFYSCLFSRSFFLDIVLVLQLFNFCTCIQNSDAKAWTRPTFYSHSRPSYPLKAYIFCNISITVFTPAALHLHYCLSISQTQQIKDFKCSVFAKLDHKWSLVFINYMVVSKFMLYFWWSDSWFQFSSDCTKTDDSCWLVDCIPSVMFIHTCKKCLKIPGSQTVNWNSFI